jgi:hypothetical protein
MFVLNDSNSICSECFLCRVTSCEISGSHCGENEDGCLLGCCALMMEAVITSEASENFYQTTRRNNPEDSHLQSAEFFFSGLLLKLSV